MVKSTPFQEPYYNPKMIALNFDGFIMMLESAPECSVFLLHVCTHNPTGVDPMEEQWTANTVVFLAKKHYAFLTWCIKALQAVTWIEMLGQ